MNTSIHLAVDHKKIGPLWIKAPSSLEYCFRAIPTKHQNISNLCHPMSMFWEHKVNFQTSGCSYVFGTFCLILSAWRGQPGATWMDCFKASFTRANSGLANSLGMLLLLASPIQTGGPGSPGLSFTPSIQRRRRCFLGEKRCFSRERLSEGFF